MVYLIKHQCNLVNGEELYMFYIGIDCGTQGTKAVIFDAESGKVIAKGYEKHPIISDDTGKREQKVTWWTDAMLAAMKTALQTAHIDRTKVRAIAVSGQQHGLVVMNEKKEVIRDVKLWNDTSTAADNEEIIERAGGMDSVWNALHTTLPVGYTASKIRYLVTKEPELYEQVRYVLLPHDYLNFFLSGNIVTESSEASGTGYYDVKSRMYSEHMINAIDPSGRLAASIPSIIAWEESVGTLRPEIASLLELPETTLIAAGGGDNTMSALGTGTIIEGTCSLSLGTSGTVIIKTPILSENQDRLVQIYDVLSDKWLATACTLNATSATTSIQELLGLSIKAFDQLMGEATVGSDGVRMIPFFGGERMPPLPQAKGVLKGLTSNNLQSKNIIRATAEAVVFTLRWGFDKLIEIAERPESLIINGGGANSAPWRQIVADVFNLPVYSLSNDEGGAFGAALQAMYLDETLKGNPITLETLCERYTSLDHTKDCHPIQANVEAYKRVYASFLEEIRREWDITV